MRSLGLLPAWLTLSALASPELPIVGKMIIGVVLAATLWDPSEGFLLTVGLAPLGALLATVFDIDAFRLTEAIALAFLTAWLIRGWPPSARGPAPPPYATRAAWLLAWLVGASVVSLGWRFWHAGGPLVPMLRQLAGNYFEAGDPLGAVESLKLTECLALFAATIVLFRTRPGLAVHLPVALAATSTAAAIASLLVWRGFGPAALLQQYARTGYRVAAHVADVNAAGSYFVLVLGVTFGMALRDRGSVRALWIAAGVLAAIGLWLSESRTALAAAGSVFSLTAVWLASRRWGTGPRLALATIVVCGLVGAGWFRLARLERDPTFQGSGMRTQFVATSLRMIAARPLYGIGVGRYYPDSTLFLSPQLSWAYGFENAHNYFLQVASETGLLGFTLFAAVIVGGLTIACRALARAPHDWRLAGVIAGVIGFLATCLAGHPLLVREVAIPFWVQFGLMVALGSSTLLNLDAERSPPRAAPTTLRSAATSIVVALILVAVPIRARQPPLAPPASHDVDGLYDWETGPDGVRFRWTTKFASLFVPAKTTRIDIPVRAPKEGGRYNPLNVDIAVGGVERGSFFASDDWTSISLPLSPDASLSTYQRIDLKVDRTWRPALVVPGSAEMRSVGIQVGEPRTITAPAPSLLVK